MDTLEALRLYVTIAETGSFSAAARQVSVSTSTVTVALQQLEEQARVTLITRSTRRLSFTFEGRRFLADARKLLAGGLYCARASTFPSTQLCGARIIRFD